MEPIKVNLTLYAYRESVGRRPPGQHTVVCRIQVNNLFPRGVPDLQPGQFFGFHRCLFVTIGRPEEWDTITKMALNVRETAGGSVTWLGRTKRIHKHGRRSLQIRVPVDIYRPPKWPWSMYTTGVFKMWQGGGVSARMYYLEVPLLTAEALLGTDRRLLL